MSWQPVALSLLSSLLFAVTFLLVRVGVRNASSSSALWVTLTINTVFLWCWSLIAYGWQFAQWWEWRWFALAGAFAPVLGRLFQFLGMARLGANITTPLALTHPVVTVLLALIFLGEWLTWLGMLGVLLVVGGSVTVGAGAGGARIGRFDSSKRIYLLLPVLASISYGVSMVFRKIGIDLGTDAVTASAATITSSWLCASLYIVLTGRVSEIRCDRHDLRIFVLAGVVSSIAPVLIFMAMRYADLVLVAPLASTTPLFVLVLSYLFVRSDEIFNRNVVLGTAATVIGVVFVTGYGLV